MSSDVEAVVRRYFETAGRLDSPEEAVLALLADDVRVVQHPNAVAPHGVVRNLAEVLEALRTGRARLSAQRFDVHEVLVAGDRAAVRCTWTAVVGDDRGRLPRGTGLSAEVASFLTVRGGRIVEQETFDCYPPLAD